MKTLLLTLLLVLALIPKTLAAPSELVKAELLADVSTVAPGEPFMVGVKLHIEPKWHVYWINPGDTGIPTEVKFDLPSGFTAGELQYPVPHRFDVGNGIVSFGYEDEVMFLAAITPPKDLKPGADVSIVANVGWLVCQESCIKGGAKVKVALKVGAKPQAANEALFAKWREQLPLGPSEKISQNARVESTGGNFKSATGSITAELGASPEKVEWFPMTPAELMIDSIDISTNGSKTIIKFKAEALAGQKISSPSFGSILAYTVNGKRVGVTVPITLSASKSSVQGS